jgi:hypothetical protein
VMLPSFRGGMGGGGGDTSINRTPHLGCTYRICGRYNETKLENNNNEAWQVRDLR